MTAIVAPPSPAAPATAADRMAERNFAANQRALAASQPQAPARLALPVGVEWIFGRDGGLTAMQEGRWWAGCSLPRRAAEFMLRDADTPGTVVCFLNPSHAGQIRAALDRMQPGQALLALGTDPRAFEMILACDDFSSAIADHSLHFAWGGQWENELDRLLEEKPGLPTPTQFIRPILADASPADALVQPAQKIFAEHAARRAARAAAIREDWTPRPVRRVCLVAPSRFRLWDDAGAAMAHATGERAGTGLSFHRFDSDDPESASPLALATAAAACDAIITPNTGRSDLPDLIPARMPWTTWVTVPRIPAFDRAGPLDTLIVADPAWKSLAVSRGWDAARIWVGGWPEQCRAGAVAREACGRGALSIVCDTLSLDPPGAVEEYSSHRLLWEAIANELLEDPFALGAAPESFLNERMKPLGLSDEGFNRALFLDRLIRHAYAQGLARLLLREQIPLRIFGAGWKDLTGLEQAAAGPIQSREQLDACVASSAALVHVWPVWDAHPMESAGRPVIRAQGGKAAFLRDARLALSGGVTTVKPRLPRLDARTISDALRSVP